MTPAKRVVQGIRLAKQLGIQVHNLSTQDGLAGFVIDDLHRLFDTITNIPVFAVTVETEE